MFFNNYFFAVNVDVYFITYLGVYRFNYVFRQIDDGFFSCRAYFPFEF